MKLEVGNYVRSKNGAIAKIEQIVDDEIHFNIKPIFSNGEEFGYNWLYIREVIKASHNIIDLIEVGDYVNGNEVMEADWINENGEYEEGLAFPMYASDDLDVIENWLPLRCVDIKSIVTKEQFESMQYKVD